MKTKIKCYLCKREHDEKTAVSLVAQGWVIFEMTSKALPLGYEVVKVGKTCANKVAINSADRIK